MKSFFLQHNQEKSYLFLDFRRLFFVFVFSPTFFIFNLGSAFFAILVSFTLLLDRIAIKLKQFFGVEFSELGYKVPKIATEKDITKVIHFNSTHSNSISLTCATHGYVRDQVCQPSTCLCVRQCAKDTVEYAEPVLLLTYSGEGCLVPLETSSRVSFFPYTSEHRCKFTISLVH